MPAPAKSNTLLTASLIAKQALKALHANTRFAADANKLYYEEEFRREQERLMAELPEEVQGMLRLVEAKVSEQQNDPTLLVVTMTRPDKRIWHMAVERGASADIWRFALGSMLDRAKQTEAA
jgi:hypothetical protein